MYGVSDIVYAIILHDQYKLNIYLKLTKTTIDEDFQS